MDERRVGRRRTCRCCRMGVQGGHNQVRFRLLVPILLLWLTHLHCLRVLNAVKVFGRGRENLNAISIWSLRLVGSSSCIPVWWHGE